MKTSFYRFAVAALLLGVGLLDTAAAAEATIATFSNFTSDALYSSWQSAKVVSSETNYSLTATGYGSNHKFIGQPPIDGAGCTRIELEVTLKGLAAADGQLGPIVTLIDGDGTAYSYRWYGQRLGHQVLTMPIHSPTVIEKPGTVPGLSLTNLQHLHLSLDPGQYGTAGPYTVTWSKLRLVGAKPAAPKP